MSWMNFSDAEEHVDRSGLIPANTLVKVTIKIKAGGYNDEQQGWTGGYATRAESGSIYLSAEYTIMGGPFDKRKVWSLIGLYSPKGPEWGNQGRSFIRAMLESARGVAATDLSERAHKARQIASFAELDGMQFVAKVGIAKGKDGYDDKNEIQTVIPATHKDYAALMNGMGAPAGNSAASQAQQPKPSAPSWAS